MLDHPTRHLHTGHAAVGGARGGPRGRTLPAGPGDGPHVFCMGGHIGRLSVSPIQIVWGFPPYVLYGTFVHFQKWTGVAKDRYTKVPGTLTLLSLPT